MKTFKAVKLLLLFMLIAIVATGCRGCSKGKMGQMFGRNNPDAADMGIDSSILPEPIRGETPMEIAEARTTIKRSFRTVRTFVPVRL